MAVIAITAAFFASIPGCSDTPLPSQVDTILADKCRQCHGENRQFGAPMSLVSWEDTQAEAPTDSSLKVWEMMQLRIHDMELPMPPRGSPGLAVHETAILDAWFAEGAPAADESK